ncbi:retropepsin-like aspartic protease, partial [Escherichia coli]|uniref:retropepsin-like aspartic protease n=1 Tax=Escherichia coli TaxID=562 RepID=UPI002574915F
KREAQREAKARQEKQRRAFLNINMAQIVDLQEDDWEVQPARLWVGLSTSKGLTQKLALIDIGASHNLMSYETWAALEKPALNPTKAYVKAVNSTTTHCLGTCTMLFHIGNNPLEGKFYVMSAGTMEEELLLGRNWVNHNKCQIDWDTRTATLQLATGAVTILMMDKAPTGQQMPLETSKVVPITTGFTGNKGK